MSDPRLIEVGKPYRGAFPPQDSFQYNFRGGQHELVAFVSRPTMVESQELRKGTVQFALLTEGDLIVLCIRFGSMPWSDAVYSIHLVPPDEAGLPDPGDEGGEKRALLTVIGVDRGSRNVLALRAVTFSAEFTAALHEAIRAQASRPFPGDAEYSRQIADLYRRYPRSADMVRDARARCTGGQ